MLDLIWKLRGYFYKYMVFVLFNGSVTIEVYVHPDRFESFDGGIKEG